MHRYFLLWMLLPLCSSLEFQNRFTTTARRPWTVRRGGAFSPAKGGQSTTRLNALFEMDQAAGAVNEFFKAQPFLAAFMTCGFKASAADLLAQSTPDSDAVITSNHDEPPSSSVVQAYISNMMESIDMQRNLAFLLYGGLYQGMFLQFLYMIAYPYLYGESDFQIPLCIFSDILAFGPFLTLPMAYVIRSMINYQQSEEHLAATDSTWTSWTEPIEHAIDKYKNHIETQNLLVLYWMCWAPAQTINWCFVPEHLRVFFVAFVSFFWVYLLSAISSQKAGESAIDETGGRDGQSNMLRPRTQSS